MKNFCLTMLAGSLLFFACSEEENPGDEKITVSDSEISMDFDETYNIEATFNRDGYAPGSLVWSSADEEVATVDNSGKVTAGLIGDTELTVKTADGKFSEKVTVEVLPTVTLYKEPVLKFGETKSYIKSNESRTFDSETDELMIFEGENSDVRGVLYLFENAKFANVGVLLKTDEATGEKAAHHVTQRYNFIGDEDNFYLFSRGDVSLGITVDATLGLIVLYFQGEASTGGRMMDFKSQLEAFKAGVSTE